MRSYHVNLDETQVERLRAIGRKKAMEENRDVTLSGLLRDAVNIFITEASGPHSGATHQPAGSQA